MAAVAINPETLCSLFLPGLVETRRRIESEFRRGCAWDLHLDSRIDTREIVLVASRADRPARRFRIVCHGEMDSGAWKTLVWDRIRGAVRSLMVTPFLPQRRLARERLARGMRRRCKLAAGAAMTRHTLLYAELYETA